MGIWNTPGPHPALEMVNCYQKYFDAKEVELNNLIDKMAETNRDIKIISDLMNKLTNAKPDKRADFSEDEEAQAAIDHIYERNPTIFDRGITYQFESEEEIDVVIQGLDAELKMLAADLNEHMMKINNEYENRAQMTENARQILKEADDHVKSMLHKIRGG